MTGSRCPFQAWNLDTGLPATRSCSPTCLPTRAPSEGTLSRGSRVHDATPTCSDGGGGQMLRRLVAISLAVLVSGYCLAQTINSGAIRVGDRWSYDIKDDLTGDLRQAITVIVVEINDKEITTRVT